MAIVLISLLQGFFVDLVLLIFRRHNLPVYALAGGLGAASNVIAFQVLYFSGVPMSYILFISGIAFISGIIFAGGFGNGVLEIVRQARPFRLGLGPPPQQAKHFTRSLRSIGLVLTILLAVAFSAGAIYYFAVVYAPPWSGPECLVEGEVERTLNFQLSQFAEEETSIIAELVGDFQHVPPQEYTGIPVNIILEAARPKAGAGLVKVIAGDGYTVEFPLEDILNDDALLLIQEDDALRLIAGYYPGGHWVR